jgi:glycosyltransferase involved in cell wall biosynthesis
LKNNNKSLLWFIHEGHMSGANLALMEHFEMLRAMQFSISVISPGEGSCTAYLKHKNIPVAIVPFYPWTRKTNEGFFIKDWFKRMLRNVYACLKMVQIAKSVDAVCTNTICTQLGLVTARLCNKKHFLFVHEFGEEDHGFKFMIPTRRAYKWFYHYSEKIALNSDAVKQKWVKLIKQSDKLELLYNCVDPKQDIASQKSHQKPAAPKFLMLGQISEAKGHSIAIEAISALAKKYSTIEMDIIGAKVSEDYYEELQTQIVAYNANVTLKPPVANPFLIFKDYTALLMCSRQEAFGRVTVEALISGLPVVGIKSGGTTEIVDHKVNGLLVNLDDLEGLKNGIEKIICMDQDAYTQMSLNAMQIKQKFNNEVSRKQLNTIFQSLIL